MADKLEATKRWRHAIERKAREYSSRANQLATLFDADMPVALATLDRVLAALESYAALAAPQNRPAAASTAGATASVARPADEMAAAEGSAAHDADEAEVAAPEAERNEGPERGSPR